jgi:hypothetical protein
VCAGLERRPRRPRPGGARRGQPERGLPPRQACTTLTREARQRLTHSRSTARLAAVPTIAAAIGYNDGLDDVRRQDL